MLPTYRALHDHDYTCQPPPGDMDDALRKIKKILETEIQQQIYEKQQLLVYKFCITDEDFHCYTKFPSKQVFSLFWEFICPADLELENSSKAQQVTHPQNKLPPIDKFFIFLCRVGAGLEEKTLSDMLDVSLSVVTHSILKWADYLYRVLGSLPTWMSKQSVQSTMPVELKMCCPELRVILSCTKITCGARASLSKQESPTTFKGLIAVAPCGLITFVSKLYPDSISDLEITKRSKVLQLLHPGDGVMADELLLNEKIFEDVGATLLTPPLNSFPQTSIKDAQKTQAAACAKSLVKRVTQRLKDYHIWHRPVPPYLTGSVNQLWVVCCLMSNYQVLLDLEGIAVFSQKNNK